MSDNAIIVNVAFSVKTNAGPATAPCEAPFRGAHGRALADQNKKDAQAFAQSIRPALLELSMVLSIWGSWGEVRGAAVAKEMNARGIPTPGGGKWHPTSVRRLLGRLGPSFREEVTKARMEASVEAQRNFALKLKADGFPNWKAHMPAGQALDSELDK